MAIRQGRCTNFGNCAAADSKQTIQVPEGADFACSECSRQLTEIGKPPSRRSSAMYVVAGGLILLIIGVVLALRVFGGGATSAVAGKVILRLSGSNTIGSELAPALAQDFLRQLGATDVGVSPGTKEDEKNIHGILPGEKEPSIIEIAAHGSATAFTGLAQRSCDIGMASRKIKADELSSLSSMGDLTSPAAEHVLGLDGIAIIVNRANQLQSITRDQLARIFSGQVTSWSDLGARAGNINVYARDDKSGTYDTFKTLILGSTKLVGNAKRFEDSNALSDAVAADPDAIGFVGLPYVRSAKALAVSDRGATPMLPNRLTVATEDYPLSRRLYFYTPENPENKYTRKFVEFALSKSGQDVVGKNGFIDQNPEAAEIPVEQNVPVEYRRLTSGAQRLTLNFRFRTGSSQLDNKALVDLDRVVTVISDLHYSGNNVMLFGFADSTGARQMNQSLSENRAKTVEDQFQQRGLKPARVLGFGADNPVASNDTTDGREKNRRVEIWVKKQ